MTALTEFSYQNTGVRMLGSKLEPWFVAVDVFRALEISPKYMARTIARLDDDEKMVVDLMGETDSSPIKLMGEAEIVQGSHNTVWVVSEPGLYKIMLRARTPAAEAFTRFVTHEVLPQIRKTGKYIPPQPKRLRGRPKVAHELSNGEKLYLSDLRVRCALYENVDVNKSAFRKAPAEECIEYINQKIAEGARINCDVDDYEPDETYFVIVDGKRIEIPM